MIFTGPLIHRYVESGSIQIEPFDPKQLNPASYDLRLGSEYVTYGSARNGTTCTFLDSKDVPTENRKQIPESGLIVRPGQLYLLHTVERVCHPTLVGVVDGKSSIGRLGLVVHATAGYIDPGFDGQITLEVATLSDTGVRIYAGMRIAQIRFHLPMGELQDYRQAGNYTGDAAKGPVASRAWRQFL